MNWAGPEGEVARAVEAQNQRVLETYSVEPRRVDEDANIERSASEGAYARRQVFELLQNAADALREKPGRCEVLLTSSTLYVANQGMPITPRGVETLMAAHRSAKRDEQIGRFGLGFKSVLAVSDSPRFFSRSGSFTFDRSTAEQRIREVVPDAEHYPVTRIATPVDPTSWSGQDVELASLMRWATTVVALPLKAGHDDIAKSLASFPGEFVLFSPHVKALDLDDRVGKRSRRVTVRPDMDGCLLLDDGGKKSRWIVNAKRHFPSRRAFEDGGYQAAREALTMEWAVPVEGVPLKVGQFWAYFPTDDFTSLSGIVNTSWKLTDDRATLLEGAFNQELLTEVLPRLVVETLPQLAGSRRPAAVVDALPARGREVRSRADDIINEPIMRAVAQAASIPTMAGTLGRPSRIKLHPDGVDADDLQLWASGCRDPQNWVDPTVLDKDRRSKITRLLNYHERSALDHKTWVEHLVRAAPDGEAVLASGIAVRLVEQLTRKNPELRSQLLQARVLLLEDKTLHSCRAGQVFVRDEGQTGDHLYIDPLLAANLEVTHALDRLGIRVLDTAGELRFELSRPTVSWENVWRSSRRTAQTDASVVFRDILGPHLLERLLVRTYAGQWRHLGQAYLAGPVVPADGSRDGAYLIDPRFHQQDRELLETLGAVAAPARHTAPPSEPWRQAAEDEARDAFRRYSGMSNLPDRALDIDAGHIPWPIEPLRDLSPAGRAALVETVMRITSADERWSVGRRDGAGNRRNMASPVWRFLARYGFLPTSLGLQPISRCLAYDEDNAVIDGRKQPLPFVEPTLSPGVSEALHLRSLDSLTEDDWTSLLQEAGRLPDEDRTLLYAWAAFEGHPPPAAIKVAKGRGQIDVPPNHAAVTASKEVYDSLVTAEVPALLASLDDAETLHRTWGLAHGEDMLNETLEHESAAEPVALIELYPPLRHYLDPADHDILLVQCSSLAIRTATPSGQRSRPLSARLDGRRFFSVASRDEDVLREVISEFDLSTTARKILTVMEEQRTNKLRAEIAETGDIAAKLILAVSAEALRRSLPEAAMEALRSELRRPLTDDEIARLALAVDGYSVLQNHKKDLSERRLDPPVTWGASRGAREWVRRLDFPIEFAGLAGESRPSEMEVQGPPRLGELHAYQRTIADRIKQLLAADAEINRGLVPLPTGAGKTRVAAQALIEVMKTVACGMRVMWIAETDELCEQAVQTWAHVWRALGDPVRPLTVSRLWKGNQVNERDGLQLVVASVSKLREIIDTDTGQWRTNYEWLEKPTVIVVDEAHKSIAPQYTRVLSRLGGTERVVSMTTPLIGLTATPYRGYNTEETQNLARRYHKNLLDYGVFGDEDAYSYLQREGVLARVEQQVLRGAEVWLSPAEEARANEMHRLPDSVEKRLGEDRERNNEILRSLRSLPSNASVLLFAASVEHARVLAALLSFHDIEARAVSGQTDAFLRRRYVEDFRAGRIRVLTNYNVFTEGFDVPQVDAVYVTRPTYSPNVYQQMIGRGLRGPLNGGNEKVLIVNVADNIANYGEQLAFHHFDHLWRERSP